MTPNRLKLPMPKSDAEQGSNWGVLLGCFIAGLFLGPVGMLFASSADGSRKGSLPFALYGWAAGWGLIIIIGMSFVAMHRESASDKNIDQRETSELNHKQESGEDQSEEQSQSEADDRQEASSSNEVNEISNSGQDDENISIVAKYRHDAEHGDVGAQFNLGKCYATGEGVEQNKIEAVKWFCKAAEQGNAMVQNLLHEIGEVTVRSDEQPEAETPEKSPEAADTNKQLIAKSEDDTDQGKTTAQTLDEKRYAEEEAEELEARKGKCTRCDGSGVIQCTKCEGAGKLSIRGTQTCQKCNGKGEIPQSVECTRCSGKGYIRARCRLCGGRGKLRQDNRRRVDYGMYTIRCDSCRGSGREPSERCMNCSGNGKIDKYVKCENCQGGGKIVVTAKRVCHVCDGECRIKCDRCSGNGFTYRPRNEQEVARLVQNAEQGYSSAQYDLGTCYDNGEGVEKNKVEAVKWYSKAAEQGHAEAQYHLGSCYAFGEGVEEVSSEAVKWWRMAAEQGHAEAQYWFGSCYMLGKGVEKDGMEAVKWIRKSAEQGFVRAQGALGGCYYNGEWGLAQDKSEAVEWYRKAAEQGDVQAQCVLGLLYYEGDGTEQDKSEAVRWWFKAAEQGDVTAQKTLRKLGYDVKSQGRHVQTGQEEASASSSYAGNPLRRFRFGEPRRTTSSSLRLSGFLGFEKVTLGYTSQGRLFSICLTASRSADSMVRALMKECDSCYSGIRWEEDNNYQGELFAVGRRRNSSGQVDMLVAIIPQSSKTDARIQANIFDYRVKRSDDGDEND